jgi:hypothetical protein
VRAFVLSAALLLPACKGCKTEVADDTGALSIVPVEVYEGAVTANSTVAADAALKAPGEITGYVLVPGPIDLSKVTGTVSDASFKVELANGRIDPDFESLGDALAAAKKRPVDEPDGAELVVTQDAIRADYLAGRRRYTKEALPTEMWVVTDAEGNPLYFADYLQSDGTVRSIQVYEDGTVPDLYWQTVLTEAQTVGAVEAMGYVKLERMTVSSDEPTDTGLVDDTGTVARDTALDTALDTAGGRDTGTARADTEDTGLSGTESIVYQYLLGSDGYPLYVSSELQPPTTELNLIADERVTPTAVYDEASSEKAGAIPFVVTDIYYRLNGKEQGPVVPGNTIELSVTDVVDNVRISWTAGNPAPEPGDTADTGISSDTGTRPADTGTPRDTGTRPADTGTPRDTGSTPVDTAADTGRPADTGVPQDTGATKDTGQDTAQPTDTGDTGEIENGEPAGPYIYMAGLNVVLDVETVD